MAILNRPPQGAPLAVIEADLGETPLDIPEAMFVSAYQRHGALLLRGFEVDFGAFRQLTDRYCSASVFNESPGREILDGALNIQTVNTGPSPFPLHPELSREPWKPDVCFFWCLHAPSSGGETTICDGVGIVENLDETARHAFASRRLRYTKRALPETCQFWLNASEPNDETLLSPPPNCPFEFGRGNGRVLQSFTRPALHKPMFANALAFGNYLLFARYMKGMRGFPTFENGEIVPDDLVDHVKHVSDEITHPIEWSNGDIAVIDNTRFMHGRNLITDVAERRIATYFGFLKFASPDPEEGPDPLWRRPGFRPPS
jgi:alpha-ketoglutarate-dependent taurine dioxygenase